MRKITLLSFAFLATYSAGVAYAQTEQSALQAAIAEAKAVLAKTGVGYPTESNAARATLNTAITTAENSLSASDQTSATSTLNEAITAYKSTTTGIQMPEDGKVYTITGVAVNGKNYYMNYTEGTGYSLVSTEATSNDGYPASSHLICRQISNTTFEFFNQYGKSFIWRGTRNGYNGNKGFMEYSERAINNNGVLTIAKMAVGGSVSGTTNAELFGYTTIKGQRCFVIKNDGTYDQADVPFYRTTGTQVSSAMKIEEVKNNVSAKFAFKLLQAEEYAAKKGVGYPAESDPARQTLSNAISAAKAISATPSEEDLNSLQQAIDAYAAADVQKPEEGKAYTITSVSKSGRRYYMYYNGASSQDRYMVAAVTSGNGNSNYPETAKLICRTTADGKFAFVDNGGRYFILKGKDNDGGANSNKGYWAAYNDASKANIPLQVSKLNNSDASVSASSQSDLIGYVTIKGKRGNEEQGYFVITSSGSYDQAGAAFYNENYSSALLIEEAQYPNTVTLNDATGIEGVQKIGTFSAPFRTIVPTGVKAYYVSGTESGNGTTATTTAIAEGEAIPANTGVLLTTTDANISSATMVPALAETDAAIAEGSNLLHASAGASKEIPTTENAYILTKQDNQVAFYLCSPTSRTIGMNKSYLVLPTTAAASKFSLNFGTVTGINNLPTVDEAESNAPVYDLTGRRVSNLQKGGLYIKGGKKFIVK